MSTLDHKIESSYITNKTTLPIFTERYNYSSQKKEGLHSHDFFEIGIVVSGSLKHHMEIGTEDIAQGSVYFIPIGFSHSVESNSSFALQNLYLLPRILSQNMTQQQQQPFSPLLHDFLLFCSNHSKSCITTLSLSKEELNSVHILLNALESTQLFTPLKDSFCYHCLLSLLIILCNCFYRTYPNVLVRKDERVYQILGIIEENLYYPTGEIIKTISDRLSLHSQYLNKLIKKELHTTLSGLILDTKIEKSCELLLQNTAITEVANILAFYDHSHYNKFFLRKLGITPSEYQMRNNKLFFP